MSNKTTTADKAYEALTDAAYCAKLLHELFTMTQNAANPTCELSDCALGGLAAINRHIFQAVIEGRSMYCEIVEE